MSGKYTPGPWREGNRFSSIIADGDTGHDDTASVKAYGGHLVCESVAMPANARLIAAAPDLLEACKAFEKYDVTDVDDGVEMMLRYAHARELMISAIAKAEGRA